MEIFMKNVERAFIVLHIKRHVHLWDKFVLYYIILAYVIMHNIILDDECGIETSIQE